ncbi:phage integrase family protein [Leifsonia rubra CMS 76R]|nr:phage integrase family protein [Leifsonia rubra CMS 76R]
MSELATNVDDYLRLRRGLGFTLAFEGVVLPQLVEYLEAAGATSVTAELAIAWAQLPQGVAPISWSHRLGAVRGFARYMTTVDAGTQVPPAGVFGGQNPRPTPYLWSERDIRALLKAAGELPSPFRAATYESFLGLLAVSGLRSGEAMSLLAGDIDLDAAVITVSQAKFGRARLIPLHSSTVTKLRSYTQHRDGLHPRSRSKTFFVSDAGTSLKSSTVNYTFRKLVTGLGLGSSKVHPRMHDLRHTFAVRTLINWHRAGHDIEARIPALVSYLGHVSPASTYWYLSASPELMELAAERLDEHFGQRS